MSLFTTWRERAIQAEERATAAERAAAQYHRIVTNAAVLVGITRDGRTNKFQFMRNGKSYTIETYGTLEDDLPGWRRELLE